MERYKKIFEQFRNEKENEVELHKDSRVLIIDGLNSFIRVFSAVPIVNDDGDHAGGYMGFMRSIAAIIRQFKPTRCVVVFDGKGGSARRRKVYSGYKEGRKLTTRFNRIEDMEQTLESELLSMQTQMGKLSEYLQCLPVTIISIDGIEADDTIAYLTTEYFRPKDSEVIIMSDDKDFLQLIDNKTSVWRPVEKKFYTPTEVLNRFGIPSHNFIHYKVFMGDPSDNVKGIKGVGIKTMQSKLPLLFEDKRIELDDVIDYCKDKQDEHKIYKTIVDNESTVRLNWQLMSLEELDISANIKRIIWSIAEQPIPKLDVFNFKKLFLRDKLYNIVPNVDSWLSQSFGILNAYYNQ